jgi:polyhydroxyalkanoate synthesis regulator phasin
VAKLMREPAHRAPLRGQPGQSSGVASSSCEVLPLDVERASDLAERLVDRGIVTVEEDNDTPEDVLRGLLVAEVRRVDGANKKQVDQRVKDLLEIDTRRRNFQYAGAADDEHEEGEARSRAVHFRDLDGYFEDAKRRLPGGTGAWYYEALIADGVPGKKAKMRVGPSPRSPTSKSC